MHWISRIKIQDFQEDKLDCFAQIIWRILRFCRYTEDSSISDKYFCFLCHRVCLYQLLTLMRYDLFVCGCNLFSNLMLTMCNSVQFFCLLIKNFLETWRKLQAEYLLLLKIIQQVHLVISSLFILFPRFIIIQWGHLSK